MKEGKKRFNLEFLIFPILLISLILRIVFLNRLPPGFWFDEASFSYSAYSVLKTGRDEFGEFLPLVFKSFGQYNAPLYFYWLIPFIWVFDLSIVGARLASAILGVLTIYGVYLLGKELFKKTEIAILASLLLSFSPFALQFNRMVHENNLLVCLLVFGTYFIIRGFKTDRRREIFIGISLLALTFYTYLAARIFTPLLIILLLLIWRKNILKKKREFLFAGAIFMILLIPFIVILSTPKAWSRAKQTSFLSDKGIVLRINEERGGHKSEWQARLLHNKIESFARVFIENYFSHLSPQFLFFEGDPVKIYRTPGIGLILFWEAPFFVLGLYLLLKNRKEGWFIIGWFLISFLPAALTRFVPLASRSFQAAPAISLISVMGCGCSSKILIREGING